MQEVELKKRVSKLKGKAKNAEDQVPSEESKDQSQSKKNCK